MQKPETKFRLWFQREIVDYAYKYWHVDCAIQKHADVVTSGVSDIEMLLCGITLWLELKVMPDTITKRKLGLTKLQERFLAIRDHHHIPAFALLGKPVKQHNGPGYHMALFAPPLPLQVMVAEFVSLPIIAERLREAAFTAGMHGTLQLVDMEGGPQHDTSSVAV